MFISMGILSKGFLLPIVKPYVGFTTSRKICNHTSHGGRNSTILMDPVSWVKRGGDWIELGLMRLQALRHSLGIMVRFEGAFRKG